MGDDWIKVPYTKALHEDVVIYRWCKSYAHSQYGKATDAHLSATGTEREFWARQAPVIEWLLYGGIAETTVAQSPRLTPDGRAVVYAFACTTGPTVHWVSVDRKLAQEDRELAGDLVRDLLGYRLEQKCGYTHDLVEMHPRRDSAGREWAQCGVPAPRWWYSDSTWFARQYVGPRMQEAA